MSFDSSDNQGVTHTPTIDFEKKKRSASKAQLRLEEFIKKDPAGMAKIMAEVEEREQAIEEQRIIDEHNQRIIDECRKWVAEQRRIEGFIPITTKSERHPANIRLVVALANEPSLWL